MSETLDRKHSRIAAFWKDPDHLIFFIIFLLFLERIATMFTLGLDYESSGDTYTYIQSGLTFIHSGVIANRNDYPSALIMPGMPVLIGLLSLVFGEGDFFLHIGLRLVWYVMGSVTAFFVYKAVCLKASKWYGIFAALAFFLPSRAWSSNVIMTETPYSLFFCSAIYFALAAGEFDRKKYRIGFAVSVFLAFMFRANILITVPITLFYWLLIKKMPMRSFLHGAALVCAALLLFIIPWTVRNYLQFHAFIPVSYGTGHPSYLGTYQGEGYPEDEILEYGWFNELEEAILARSDDELDYATNAVDVIRTEYADYFNADGSIKDPVTEQFLTQELYGQIARYRLSVWAKTDFGSLLKSFLIIKPRWALNWVWYWDQIWGVSSDLVHRFAQLNLLVCMASVLLCFVLKKDRDIMIFLCLNYLFNLYINALAFVSDRYSYNTFALRYIIPAIGLAVLVEQLRSRKKKNNIHSEVLL